MDHQKPIIMFGSLLETDHDGEINNTQHTGHAVTLV
jgi:hypothetical protein